MDRDNRVDGELFGRFEDTVPVGLKHMHPFLAEYKRFLEDEGDGEVEKKEIFPDTGGYAWSCGPPMQRRASFVNQAR